MSKVLRSELTALTLRAWLMYEPNTGLFRWRKKPCNRVSIGDEAGSIDRRGYIEIQVANSRDYALHEGNTL